MVGKPLGPVKNGVQKYENRNFRRGYAYLVHVHGEPMKYGFERKEEAEAYRDELKRKRRLGELVNAKKAEETVLERGEQWLKNSEVHTAPSTHRKYESTWHNHVAPRWGDIPIGGVLNSDVQAWVTELSARYSGGTVRDILSVLRRILNTAVKDRILPWNPCDDITLPKVKVAKEHRYLTMGELLALADAADRRKNKYGTLVLTMGTTGMRFSEVRALRVRNVDFRECRIRVCENAVPDTGGVNVDTPKNGETRIVPFPKRLLLDRLKAKCSGKGEDDLVFERPGALNDGAALTSDDYMRDPDSNSGWLVYAARDAGLERLTSHDLRHTAVSLAISSGANIKVVQRIAGHKSATMTLDRYADLFPIDLGDLAERLDDMAFRTNPVPTAGELLG